MVNVIRRLPARDLFDSSNYVLFEPPKLKFVVSDFLKERNLKPGTRRDYEKRLFEVADWMDTPVTEISKKMIFDRHKSISERGTYQASVVMRVIRSILSYAQVRYEDEAGNPYLKNNPVEILKQLRAWHRPVRKKTTVNRMQLPDWWKGVNSCGNQTVSHYLILLLLTGLRRSEAASLRWQNVDLKNRTLFIEDTKNGDPLKLPLGNYLTALIEERSKTIGKAGFVFPGKMPGQHIVNCNKTYEKIIAKSGVKFSLHDLRRTFASTATEIGIDGYTIKRLMNHRGGNDVTYGYLVFDVDGLREPMQRIEDAVLRNARKN